MRELFPTENPIFSSAVTNTKKPSEKNSSSSFEAKKIWEFICDELHSQLGEDVCKKWIFPIRTQASHEDELILIVPSISFYQIVLRDYLELIERCKNKLGFEHISIVIDLDRDTPTPVVAKDKERHGLFDDAEYDSLHKKLKSKKTKSIKKKSPSALGSSSLAVSNPTSEQLNVDQENKNQLTTSTNFILDENPDFTNKTSDNTQPNAHISSDQIFHSNQNLSHASSTDNSEHLDPATVETESESEHRERIDEIVGWGKIEAVEGSEKDSAERLRSSSDTLFSHSLSRKTKLNPNYTFDTFVRGPSNQFALAACYNVAENPGKTYNPLFIYGATGLGKTHLLHAVGNHIIKTNPNATIAYISSERFMNELIYCLRHNKIIDFRQKYRHCDLFLMDDIQFISGNKAATQEEFFHTFNTLYEAKKQIIITSDLFPQDIPDIEERLRNRFQWGLIADIQPPDIEHRIAILYSKAEQLGIRLSIDVAEYIANLVRRNVRELEGALHRLAAFAALHGKTLDKTLAMETFSNMLSEDSSKPQMMIDAVQKIVAEHFQIKTSDLKSKRRHKALTLPRQVAMYLARKFTKTSYPEIGEKFGGKDHTTVMHAVRKITSERKRNMDLMVHLESLERVLERLN